MVHTQAIKDTGPGFNIIWRSAMPSGWQQFVVPDHIIRPVRDTNWNLLSITSDLFLRVCFGNSVFRTLFFIADDLIVDVLIETRFINRHVYIICRTA